MRTASRFPKDLNALVHQRFFRCMGCNDLFPARKCGAHNKFHCGPCRTKHRAAQQKAAAALQHAIKRGEIRKIDGLSCVDCGLPATDYDHRSYETERALDVVPTCHSCNIKRGPAGWNSRAHEPQLSASLTTPSVGANGSTSPCEVGGRR